MKNVGLSARNVLGFLLVLLYVCAINSASLQEAPDSVPDYEILNDIFPAAAAAAAAKRPVISPQQLRKVVVRRARNVIQFSGSGSGGCPMGPEGSGSDCTTSPILTTPPTSIPAPHTPAPGS